MENVYGHRKEDDGNRIDLPPGFRFHPTDEELITHYLSKKILDSSFNARATGEVDLNTSEPWDLPWKAKMGEKQWYFFCAKDRKYTTGLRTNRATEAGHWKATGKDKEIYRGKTLVGMKKTLVFYKGRAPKGEKTNWVMHEFRLDGKYSLNKLPKTHKKEWVICRIFQKSTGGKKNDFSNLVRLSSLGDAPLMDSSHFTGKTRLTEVETAHATCFSNLMEGQINQEEIKNNFKSSLPSASVNLSDISPSWIFSKAAHPSSFYSCQAPPNLPNLQYPGPLLMQDESILRVLVENDGSTMEQSCKEEMEMVSILQENSLITDSNIEISLVASNHEMGKQYFKDQDDPFTSDGPVVFDCLWNY